jgi:hypothetical protein
MLDIHGHQMMLTRVVRYFHVGMERSEQIERCHTCHTGVKQDSSLMSFLYDSRQDK